MSTQDYFLRDFETRHAFRCIQDFIAQSCALLLLVFQGYSHLMAALKQNHSAVAQSHLLLLVQKQAIGKSFHLHCQNVNKTQTHSLCQLQRNRNEHSKCQTSTQTSEIKKNCQAFLGSTNSFSQQRKNHCKTHIKSLSTQKIIHFTFRYKFKSNSSPAHVCYRKRDGPMIIQDACVSLDGYVCPIL